MHRLTVWLVVLLYLGTFVQECVFARDDGRFANSTLKQWFDQLASVRGLCCSFADGVSGGSKSIKTIATQRLAKAKRPVSGALRHGG